VVHLAILVAFVLPGLALWALHQHAWGLGDRSPVLNYDSAQYALAARELADHGRLATTFALPIELVRHAAPPWPLAVVQPGLVLAEAALFRLVPAPGARGADPFIAWLAAQERRAWLTLVLPLFCYLMLGGTLAWAARRLLARHAPWVGHARGWLAGATLALAALLDPEAQHFAVGGFTELPFTLGLVCACAALVSAGGATRRPLLFGLLLGVTGSFRASGLWLAPLFALAAAAIAPERRARVLGLALLGFALPLAPWWFYKWRAFGHPGWDLSSLILWEGVQGRSWFSLFHLPESPVLPHGPEAVGLLAAKVARRIRGLLLALATGPRTLWAGALVLWLLACRPPRPLAVTAVVILAANLLSLIAAAASIPWIRFLFPTRILLEPAGLLALWGLLARAPATMVGARLAGALRIATAALAIGWGVTQTVRGLDEAVATSQERAVPDRATLHDLAHRLDRQVSAREPVMSNLGPILAWYAARPVVHLAETPADIAACRRRLEFRHVLVVFRDAGSAWPGWQEVVARPEEAARQPEWNVVRQQHWRTGDFTIVWLELGPLEPSLAQSVREDARDAEGLVAARR
jgi:hypothetical protein